MAKKNGVSMSQIAEQLNLSQGTVSIVLNGRGNEMRISPETQKRIIDTARQMGYPLEKVRKVRQTVGENGNPVITVFVPCMENEVISSYNRIIAGITWAMKELEVQAEILVCPFEYNDLAKKYQYLTRSFCSGAIIVAMSEQDLDGLSKQEFNIPIVVFNHVNEKYASVYVDDYRAGYRVAELFKERGHKKVGILMSDNRNKAMGLRVVGFMDGCRQHGLELKETFVMECILSRSGAAQATRKLLETGEMPEAVFATVDDLALGMIQEMKKAGVEIPGQMEIMSYGDNSWVDMLSPALSSIRLPIEEMCQTCFQMLWHMIQSGDWAPISRIHMQEFVFRESCGGYPD